MPKTIKKCGKMGKAVQVRVRVGNVYLIGEAKTKEII
jgi:hypothetical protein